jgi:hypothetical protein
MVSVKNLVLQHGASSKEKAILAIYPRSSARGIMAFSCERLKGIDLSRSVLPPFTLHLEPSLSLVFQEKAHIPHFLLDPD